MSYSEAITKNDLKKILGNIGFGSLNDYIIEQGTSGSWNYRKWKSGYCELWGQFYQTQSAYTTGGFIIGNNSITKYPFTIIAPLAQATALTIGNGGGYITFDYSRTDYWSGIAESKAQHATGTNLGITWNLHVMGKWKNDVDTYQGIGSIGAVLLDIFHPVGSYYETSDSAFDPNTAWGGTWNKETVFGNSKLLFNNDSAEISQTTVTLSDSVENYGSITVCYKDNDNIYHSVTVSNPVNKTFGLIASWGRAENYLYYKTGLWRIGTTTLTEMWECEYAITTTPNVTRTVKNVFAITQVIAYKTLYRWHRTA